MTSRPSPSRRGRSGGSSRAPSASEISVDDAFFRQIVAGIRNGILAITRTGALALLNDEGYRIFGVEPHHDDFGKPVSEVLRAQPDVVRLLLSAFDLHMLPNR